MKRLILVLPLVPLACMLFQCRSGNRPIIDNAQRELLRTISDKNITQAELVDAVGRLTLPPQETPGFWNDIANDYSYSTEVNG